MDRLNDLKRGAAPVKDSGDEHDSDRVSLVGNAKGSGSKEKDGMQEFFGDIEIVKSSIVLIKDATRKVSEINQNVNQATTAEKEQSFSIELEPLLKSTNKKASVAKELLKRLRADTDSMKAETGTKKLTPEIRIRENLTSTLTRKFVDVMVGYQNAQSKYKTDIKKKVKRQVQYAKPDATVEEIDQVMQSGGSSEFLKNSILTGEAADSIQNAFKNAQSKYQDVLTLEASVNELHQMFTDFALLVEKQGDLLDQIEYQVKEAGDYIDQGNVELVEAIELQKSIRFKQCIIAIIILVILGIIAGIVAAKVTGAF